MFYREDALETVEISSKYLGKGVVGLDWCGNPNGGVFNYFLPAFQKGRQLGLKCTIHFGEIDEPENVIDIIRFRPERVGHATVLSSEAVDLLLENPIPIEICFTSNLLCKTVQQADLHHFGSFNNAGYPLVICTDDKGVFDSTLSQEYYKIATAFSLNKEQIQSLAKNAIHSIFDTEETKAKLRAYFQ